LQISDEWLRRGCGGFHVWFRRELLRAGNACEIQMRFPAALRIRSGRLSFRNLFCGFGESSRSSPRKH
jgi:hypothetical protein